MLPFIALGLAFLVFSGKRNNATSGSLKPMTDGDKEDSKGVYVSSSQETEPQYDEPYSDLLGDAIGAPYSWGGGSPSTPWDDIWEGVDCGGAVQMAQVRIGILDPNSEDMGAGAIADDCYPIEVGSQIPGDVAIYPGHVMLVYSEPRADKGGHSAVWGASGGDSTVHGDKPSACIKVFNTATYNNRFVCYGRRKSTYNNGPVIITNPELDDIEATEYGESIT